MAAGAMASEGTSELLLAGQGLRDDDAERLGARILEEQQTLTSLDLRGNELTDAACDALAASIAVVPSLRLVDLTDNAITNAGRLTIFRALANARRRCNVLLSGDGVRDILLAVKQAPSVNPSQPIDTRAAPERHEPPLVPTQTQREAASSPSRSSPPRFDRTASPSALAEKAIADAERAMARSSPFDKRVDAEREVRYGTDASRRREADNFSGNQDLDPALATRASRREADVFTNDADLEPALSSRASPSASAAPDEICLQDRGLTAVPSRLGEDRPGRVRPRKIDLSDNMIKSLSGLPQSVVQLKAANNSLRDWEGINTLPRLQRLDLSYNQIHQMGPFGICCAIRVLRLKGNAIGTLAGIEGAARTLIELDVSDNVLRCVDDIQPLTGCTRLTSVKLDGNPLLKDVVRTTKSRAYRGILARLPKGCTLVDNTTMPSGPLFTPSRPSNRANPGSSLSSYSERRRQQATPSSNTTAKTKAARGGASWPRRAGSIKAAAQRDRVDRGGSAVAVDLSAPSPGRAWDAHTMSSLVPPEDDIEPYKPAIRADNLHPQSNTEEGPSSRPTIFSTGGSGPRPTSPLQQRSRRHWSPSGRRNDAKEAKVKAVAPRPVTNKHLSFRGKDQRRTGASVMGDLARPSASNLMTPTKSIESKYARLSPPRSGNDANPLGRLAGHPGWPASPPPSAPQRLEEVHSHHAEVGASLGPTDSKASVGHSDVSAHMARRSTSAPKRRPRRSPSPSRVHGSPSASLSARADGSGGIDRVFRVEGESMDENETVVGLNAKITKLYNWHLAEMDLVQKQQMQLNQVTAELEETRLALGSQEKLIRLQLAADADGMPIGDISMAHSDLHITLDSGSSSNSMDAAAGNPERPGGTAAAAPTDPGEVAVAAIEAAVAAVGSPARFSSASGLTENMDRSVQADTSRLHSTDAGGDTSSVLPPEPTMRPVDLSGVPFSTPIKLQDLQEELRGTVDELNATRKALGHALTIMQSAGIADGKLKSLRQILHQSGVTSPGPASPSV